MSDVDETAEASADQTYDREAFDELAWAAEAFSDITYTLSTEWSPDQERLLRDALSALEDVPDDESPVTVRADHAANLEAAASELTRLLAAGELIQCPFCSDITVPGPDECGESRFPKCDHFVGHWDSESDDDEDEGDDEGDEEESIDPTQRSNALNALTSAELADLEARANIIEVEWSGDGLWGWQVTYRFAEDPDAALVVMEAAAEREREEDDVP